MDTYYEKPKGNDMKTLCKKLSTVLSCLTTAILCLIPAAGTGYSYDFYGNYDGDGGNVSYNPCCPQPCNPCCPQPCNPCCQQPSNPCCQQPSNPCCQQPCDPCCNQQVSDCCTQCPGSFWVKGEALWTRACNWLSICYIRGERTRRWTRFKDAYVYPHEHWEWGFV